jgi:hypothetical protein
MNTEPLPLDVRLPPGEVRAGRIRSDAELVGGLTAKARIGDYKIYNDRIAVTIASAETAIGFHPYGGVILDADVVRDGPGASAFGEVVIAYDFQVLETEAIEVVSDGRSGEARIRVTGSDGTLPIFHALIGDLFTPADRDLGWTLDYVLAPSATHLSLEYTLHNRGDLAIELAPLVGFFFGTGADPFLEGRGFSASNSLMPAAYYGAASPDVSYLYGRPGAEIGILFGESGLIVATYGDPISLRARERKTLVDRLVIGTGDLASTRAEYRRLAGAPFDAKLEGRVLARGAPVEGARIHVLDGDDYVVRGVSGPDGRFAIPADAGAYQLVASTDRIAGDPIDADTGSPMELALPETGRIEWSIREDGARVPAKISLLPLDAPPRHLPRHYGEREHGGRFERTEYTAGDGSAELQPGRYAVFASRGGEYEVATASVSVVANETVRFDAALARSVRTPRWMTAEPHVHAQLSSDSRDLYPFKVQAMAAENIELPISTDHEWIGDFEPAIHALGLERWLQGIVGTEISTVRYGHFNAFPLLQDRTTSGFGRVLWYGRSPADMFALVRARPEAPFLQVNHPRSTTVGYFELIGLDPVTLTAAKDGLSLSLDFDGLEVVNGCDQAVLDGSTIRDWLAFLGHGRRVSATASLDDHTAGRGEMGYPVTYVRMPADAPRGVTPADLRSAFLAGRLTVSCGPFIEIRVGSAEIGDVVEGRSSELDVAVHVEAASWVDVDRLHLLVDGEVARTIPIDGRSAVRFDATVTASIARGRDTFIIGWVEGDTPHGPWANARRSVAFTNPIFVDADGDGRWR